MLNISTHFESRFEIERNYNPYETTKHTCGKTVVSTVDMRDYNVMFNTTWKYRGEIKGERTR